MENNEYREIGKLYKYRSKKFSNSKIHDFHKFETMK